MFFCIYSQRGRWRRRYNLRGFRPFEVERRNRSLTVFRRHLDTYRSSDFDATMSYARRKLHNFVNDANSSYVAATNLNDVSTQRCYCLLLRYRCYSRAQSVDNNVPPFWHILKFTSEIV